MLLFLIISYTERWPQICQLLWLATLISPVSTLWFNKGLNVGECHSNHVYAIINFNCEILDMPTFPLQVLLTWSLFDGPTAPPAVLCWELDHLYIRQDMNIENSRIFVWLLHWRTHNMHLVLVQVFLRPVAGRSPHSNVSYISYLNSTAQAKLEHWSHNTMNSQERRHNLPSLVSYCCLVICVREKMDFVM